MREFPASPIAALVDETPRYDLAESYGSDLSVAELLGPDGSALLGSIKLGYRTSLGDPDMRALVAGRTGVTPDQVLVTAGAAAALFLVALLFGDGGGEVVNQRMVCGVVTECVGVDGFVDGPRSELVVVVGIRRNC